MTGAGLSDQDLELLYKELNEFIIKEPPRNYDVGNVSVDVWFEPKMVWEVKTADLSQSPIYTAANNLTDDERGISLRFPRYIRTRPDKKPEECTSSSDILRMFKDQEKLTTKKINFAEEDFYD
jgi:DNA ligase-1